MEVVKAFIFDLDGVLVSTDEQHYKAWKSLADCLGIPFSRKDNEAFRGVSRMSCMDKLAAISGRQFTKQEKTDCATWKNEQYRRLLDSLSPADLSPDVKTTLDMLRAGGLLLAVGSSSKNARYILARIGLGDYFDAVCDGTNIAKSKPDPEVFLKAAQMLKVLPSQSIVVEDAVVGLQAAKAAGMTACAIGGAISSPLADIRIKYFSELVQYVERINDEKVFDLAYASSSASQKLDLYLPSNPDELHPLILFAHGGAFTFGDKRDNQLTPILRGLDRGFAVASLEYRKAEDARFPAMVYDAKAAVRFLRAHAADYNLDPEQFFGWGPSSGGWLMSMLGVTAGNPAFEDLSMGYSEQRSDLQAVVDWCGPCGNFLQMDKAFLASGAGVADHDQPDSPESRFLGAQITHLPELCRMSAPCSYASETTPPFLIVHGGADQIVPVEQSLTFYRALVAATNDTRHKLHIESGQPHHGASWYNDPWVANMGFSFLEDILTF